MNYLKKLGLNDNDIKTLEENTPTEVIEIMKNNDVLVWTNVNFLIDIGITNYIEALVKYPKEFLANTTDFRKKFTKYELSDLIKKMAKNVCIIEML